MNDAAVAHQIVGFCRASYMQRPGSEGVGVDV
jgi:hypothetical protein